MGIIEYLTLTFKNNNLKKENLLLNEKINKLEQSHINSFYEEKNKIMERTDLSNVEKNEFVFQIKEVLSNNYYIKINDSNENDIESFEIK